MDHHTLSSLHTFAVCTYLETTSTWEFGVVRFAEVNLSTYPNVTAPVKIENIHDMVMVMGDRRVKVRGISSGVGISIEREVVAETNGYFAYLNNSYYSEGINKLERHGSVSGGGCGGGGTCQWRWTAVAVSVLVAVARHGIISGNGCGDTLACRPSRCHRPRHSPASPSSPCTSVRLC
ncbi:hypothetical protein J6590_068312 [Homalodisca vitripennis]|nr:hypothetical protein J6590_068312 [Homalodisca vitripennis]